MLSATPVINDILSALKKQSNRRLVRLVIRILTTNNGKCIHHHNTVQDILKQAGILPETAAAPTCQTCHMPDGNHEVRTAGGFLAVRLPMPEYNQWAADRADILKALDVLRWVQTFRYFN